MKRVFLCNTVYGLYLSSIIISLTPNPNNDLLVNIKGYDDAKYGFKEKGVKVIRPDSQYSSWVIRNIIISNKLYKEVVSWVGGSRPVLYYQHLDHYLPNWMFVRYSDWNSGYFVLEDGVLNMMETRFSIRTTLRRLIKAMLSMAVGRRSHVMYKHPTAIEDDRVIQQIVTMGVDNYIYPKKSLQLSIPLYRMKGSRDPSKVLIVGQDPLASRGAYSSDILGLVHALREAGFRTIDYKAHPSYFGKPVISRTCFDNFIETDDLVEEFVFRSNYGVVVAISSSSLLHLAASNLKDLRVVSFMYDKYGNATREVAMLKRLFEKNRIDILNDTTCVSEMLCHK